MGSLNSNVCDSSTTGKQSKHKPAECVFSRFQPMFRGVSVCMEMFLFAFHCSRKLFKSVKKQFRESGLDLKIHANVHATAKSRGFNVDMIYKVKTFIQNYAETFGLVLPGRVASFNNADLMILPSSSSKVSE